jgi:hypothetical protein
MRQGIQLVTAAAAALFAAACATVPASIPVESVKADDANFTPKRVYLVTHLAPLNGQGPFGPRFNKVFEARLASNLAACGIETYGFEDSGLRLDDQALMKAIDAFKADTVIEAWADAGLRSASGVILYKRFNVTLQQVQRSEPAAGAKREARVVWRSMSQHGGDATRLVDSLTGKMMDDGFFPGCARPGPGDPAPAVGGGLTRVAYVPSSTLRAAGGLSVSAVAYTPALELEAAAKDSKKPASGYNSTSAAMVPVWVKPEKKPVVSAPAGGGGGGAIYAPHPENSAHLKQPWDPATPSTRSKRPTAGHNSNTAASMAPQPWDPPASEAEAAPDAYELHEEGYPKTRLDVPVSELVGKGVAAELGAMGIQTTDSRRLLTVTIDDFILDRAVGYGFGSALRVRYELQDAETGKVLYSAEKLSALVPEARAVTVPQALTRAIRLNVEMLVRDEEFAAAIR